MSLNLIKTPTPPRWTELVLGNLATFLADHASCERKAHAAAMMLVNRYPEHETLQDRMIALAREELLHFQQVVGLMRARSIALGPDIVDDYVKELMKHVRHPKDLHLLDRLVAAAFIEARSCERFFMVAAALPNGELKEFYQRFALEEEAHAPMFLETAKLYFASDLVEKTVAVFADKESDIMAALPIKPTVH